MYLRGAFKNKPDCSNISSLEACRGKMIKYFFIPWPMCYLLCHQLYHCWIHLRGSRPWGRHLLPTTPSKIHTWGWYTTLLLPLAEPVKEMAKLKHCLSLLMGTWPLSKCQFKPFWGLLKGPKMTKQKILRKWRKVRTSPWLSPTLWTRILKLHLKTLYLPMGYLVALFTISWKWSGPLHEVCKMSPQAAYPYCRCSEELVCHPGQPAP